MVAKAKSNQIYFYSLLYNSVQNWIMPQIYAGRYVPGDLLVRLGIFFIHFTQNSIAISATVKEYMTSQP